LGTTTRDDGSMQVTYNGHPLYTYVSDTSAGATNGQGVNLNGGLWWVVSPGGSAITGSSPSPSHS
jgi:predicted lipoprotein with Yx(FWY)xxD motif